MLTYWRTCLQQLRVALPGKGQVSSRGQAMALTNDASSGCEPVTAVSV
jgi:hypothetical protein